MLHPSSASGCVIISINVDDIIIVRDDMPSIKEVNDLENILTLRIWVAFDTSLC